MNTPEGNLIMVHHVGIQIYGANRLFALYQIRVTCRPIMQFAIFSSLPIFQVGRTIICSAISFAAFYKHWSLGLTCHADVPLRGTDSMLHVSVKGNYFWIWGRQRTKELNRELNLWPSNLCTSALPTELSSAWQSFNAWQSVNFPCGLLTDIIFLKLSCVFLKNKFFFQFIKKNTLI